MRKKVERTILLSFLFFILASIFSSSIQAFHQCVTPAVCVGNKGEVVSDHSLCTKDNSKNCPQGYVCCKKNWSDIVYNEKEPSSDFKIFGADMEAEDAKRLIKTSLLLGISGIAFGLMGVIVYGGVIWATAGDKEDQLQKARKTIKNGFMALLITIGGVLALGIIAGLLGVNISNSDWIDDVLSG